MPPIPTATDIEKAQRSALSWGMNNGRANANGTTNGNSNGHTTDENASPVPQPVPSQAGGSHADTLGFLKSSANSFMAKHGMQSEPNVSHATAAPPPIPESSRPDLTALQATKPKLNGNAQASPVDTNICLICRDFSGPDNHAARFPRQTVRDLRSLAYDLTASFSSQTDKARAIFSWLHHNISYDVDSFFNNNVQGSTPDSTLRSGLAVCEGYAGLYAALATYAGLECIVLSGASKGFGYTPLAPGAPVPPFTSTHAWNVVRIDGGEWKLVDPCWGAGHVQGKGLPYVKKFAPQWFNMTNEEFGIKHFPTNSEHQFLPGGRQVAYEDYARINPTYWPSTVEGPTVFSNAPKDYYIAERSVLPRNRKISVNHGGLVRFQFGLLCPHFTLDGHGSKGPPPVFLLLVEGIDGRNKDYIPLQYYKAPAGQGGDTWYVDIDSRELGAPGQKVSIFAVTKFGDRTDTRGLTVREFANGKGRVGMAFAGVAAWELVA
jgi:hypothetical protein